MTHHTKQPNKRLDQADGKAMLWQCELISVFERDDEDGEENSSNYIS